MVPMQEHLHKKNIHIYGRFDCLEHKHAKYILLTHDKGV